MPCQLPTESSEGGRNTDFNILVHLLHSKLFGGILTGNREAALCG